MVGVEGQLPLFGCVTPALLELYLPNCGRVKEATKKNKNLKP